MIAGTGTVVIERLVVEGGFLDGLDQRFVSGLNVLIGERGAGKTSVIELLRFALGTPALTERFARLAREHTASVLGDGRVSVSLLVNGERRTTSRRIGDAEPEGDPPPPPFSPIVLSQNEIEAVGLDASGRLRLLDGFISPSRLGARSAKGPDAVLASVASLSAEIRALDKDIEETADRLAERERIREELKQAEAELTHREVTAARASSQMPELNRLADETAERSVRTAALERGLDEVREWRERLLALGRAIPELPNDALERSPNARDLAVTLRDVERSLVTASQRVIAAENAVDRELQDERRAQAQLNERARELRLELERVQAGAGSAIRRVTELKEAAAQLDALAERLDQLNQHRDERRRERTDRLAELADIRADRFAMRQTVASELSAELGPRIRVRVEPGAMRGEYAQAITDLLKGSGLRYAQLAPALAAALSASELVDAIESDDVDTIRARVDLSPDRTRRLFDALRAADLGALLTAAIEDAVVLMLLDGADYKPTPVLSTGQRCTVVLPILMRHDERPLIIDQPEDHLDNAYVVDALVRAIGKRQPGSQLIVSTHNPNIPVLGNATSVTLMGSDGRRGFSRFTGALEDQRVVRAITTVMEGGADAFRRRASFYQAVMDDA